MKSLTWTLLPTVLGAGLALAKVPLSSVKRISNTPTVPNRFIVEVDSLASIPNGKRSPGSSPYEFLYAALRKREVGFEVNKEFDSQGLFVGAALTLTDGQDAAILENTPGIKAIRPVRRFTRPAPVKIHAVTGPNDAAIPPDSQSTHVLTGVDKLHAEGVIGTGVKIGIIDSGIDYTHPLLGAGFGPGHKVIGGFDFVGDEYDGTNAPIPDSDPLDQCEGHGTHVAGILGANPGSEYNISGVAYGASISAYRAFGCVGTVTDDILVDALLMAYQDGQDIITLSLGEPDGWTESTVSVVASRIAATGTIVTIGVGNEGASGSWYTNSPGTGIDVISVASLENTVIPLQNATVGGVEHPPITYFRELPLPFSTTFPIYATSNDPTVEDDACNPLPPSIPDLSKFVVIVRRGSCSFVQKVANIAAKGAKLALIYNNGNDFNVGISVGDFPAALIQAKDGAFLVSQFTAGVPVTITFPQHGGSTNFPDPNGGLISAFTSYGPSYDFFFKPSVAAPGGNILSLLPVKQGSFGVESGTSMATPFVAGSAALLLSVKGKSKEVGRTARTLFETTSRRVPSSHTDGDPLQTVTQQGAGLINVFDAIHATTIISPSQLILNDTAHFNGRQTFSVKNTDKTAKIYKLAHVPAGTAITVTPGTIFPALGPVPLSSAAASVSLSQKTFTLQPGQSQTVTATFSLPQADASTFPVFSGFIEVVSGAENFHVTYLGLAASLKNKQVIDTTDYIFGVPLPAVLDSVGNVQEAPTNYTFAGGDFPTVLFRLVFGTPAFRVDLVDPNIELKGVVAPRAEGPGITFPQSHRGGSFAQVSASGPIIEVDFLTRNNENDDNGYYTISLGQPIFANGTTIPNGSYRLLVQALKVTGDATNQEDYESWLSPIIGVTA